MVDKMTCLHAKKFSRPIWWEVFQSHLLSAYLPHANQAGGLPLFFTTTWPYLFGCWRSYRAKRAEGSAPVRRLRPAPIARGAYFVPKFPESFILARIEILKIQLSRPWFIRTHAYTHHSHWIHTWLAERLCLFIDMTLLGWQERTLLIRLPQCLWWRLGSEGLARAMVVPAPGSE